MCAATVSGASACAGACWQANSKWGTGLWLQPYEDRVSYHDFVFALVWGILDRPVPALGATEVHAPLQCFRFWWDGRFWSAAGHGTACCCNWLKFVLAPRPISSVQYALTVSYCGLSKGGSPVPCLWCSALVFVYCRGSAHELMWACRAASAAHVILWQGCHHDPGQVVLHRQHASVDCQVVSCR